MEMRDFSLLTDFYELTMMQGYFETKSKEVVIFDAFYRYNPFDGGYAVCAGLEQIIEYIKNLRFKKEDIEYLRSLGAFKDEFLDYLSDFKFSGDIYAIPEGTVIFPYEPLVKVEAPIMEAQLIEPALLNILNHQSLIATKASRVCYAAKGDGVMEFGLRRAQGPDAATYGARAAVIGGCVGTSNVVTGKLFNVPVLGTHAHSWIMSFPDEYTAFMTYAKMYPNACTLLVDTYDTLNSGVPNAIRVFKDLEKEGFVVPKRGIRLDSGDIAYLSKKARKMLDDAGLPDVVICASNDLDENLIESLKIQGATVTSWGVGTNLITAKDNPSFGGVYKLAAIKKADGTYEPKIKLSNNTEKITNPGNKKIYRIYDNFTKKIKADLICLNDEVFNPDEDMVIFDPTSPWKKTLLAGGSYSLRELLIPVIKGGEVVYESPSVMEIRDICTKEKDTLWEEVKRLVNPSNVYVDLSEKLYNLKIDILNKNSKA